MIALDKWTSYALAVFDWFIPQSIITSDAEHRRLRTYVVSHLVGPITVLIMCAHLFALQPSNPPLLFYILGTGGILFFLYNFILKFTGAYQILTLVSIVQFNLLIFVCAYFFYGHMTLALAWGIVSPMVSLFFTNSPSALRLSIASVFVGFVAIYSLELSGHNFPPPTLIEHVAIIEMVSVICATIFGSCLACMFFYMFKASERKLYKLAKTDSLTGANNRRHFVELTEQEIHRAQRTNASMCIMLLDIDFFKKINDTYGHQAGDAVLQVLSKICHRILRQHDIFARIGGEEFAITLPMTTSRKALQVAERLRQEVEQTPMLIPGGQTIFITVSIGLGELNQSSSENIDDMIKRADSALYKAKHRGRNQTVKY